MFVERTKLCPKVSFRYLKEHKNTTRRENRNSRWTHFTSSIKLFSSIIKIIKQKHITKAYSNSCCSGSGPNYKWGLVKKYEPLVFVYIRKIYSILHTHLLLNNRLVKPEKVLDSCIDTCLLPAITPNITITINWNFFVFVFVFLGFGFGNWTIPNGLKVRDH